MKKLFFLSILLVAVTVASYGQNYNNLANYFVNGTPVNGVKIKTNIPYVTSSFMPTIIIQGYNYLTGSPIGLTLNFYIYGNPTPVDFIRASISSYGNYNPAITLANENGKVVIFINDKPYFLRFTVSAFSMGLNGETATNFQGWTVVDEALTGTNQLLLPYKNSFSGLVSLPGEGVWNNDGNVGIGTSTPDAAYRLSVNGKIRAKEIKVESGWADYVFQKNYKLPALDQVNAFINKNKHLPEIPTEKEIAENGLALGEMMKLQMKKIEELTLYLIEKDKELKVLRKRLHKLENRKK